MHEGQGEPHLRNTEDDGGKYLQYDRRDGEELARGSKLYAVVHLLPVREKSSLALVWGLKGGAFHRMQEDVHALQQTTNSFKGNNSHEDNAPLLLETVKLLVYGRLKAEKP